MKKAINYLVCICLLLVWQSCVKDDDYDIPESLNAEENSGLNSILEALENGTMKEISISSLKQQFVEGEVVRFLSNSVVKGYVSSSDRTGNFYKEIYIQDAPVNPTSAINVVLNQVDSYNQFNLGREVYISLKDLYLGETVSEIMAIGGGIDGTRIDLLSEYQIKSHFFRSSKTETLEPLLLDFSDLNENYVGMFVSVNNVEFPESLEGLSYFNATDDFDTQHVLQRCEGFSYEHFLLETSSFATFKNEILPSNNGSVSGIISKSYGGDDLVLILNDTDDVQFENERCTPLNVNDFTVVFEETFQDAIDNTILDTKGWSNFSERGSVLWTEQIYSKNGYAEFGTYGANDTENVGWLISPAINLEGLDYVILNFKLAQHHVESVRNKIEVFMSSDFDGKNVLNASWEQVSAKVPGKYDEWYVFKDSGIIDISAYSGVIYVAFRVLGSGTNEALDGSFQLDDFRVLTTK